MSVRPPRVAARPRRFALILVTALVGVATAALVSVAVAKTFTLEIAKHAKISDLGAMAATANIAVNSKGHAVYTLSGDSKTHQKCTKSNGCWGFWPPATIASGKKPTAQKGIKGKLGTWRHGGINQLTLNRHPLYTFSMDTGKNNAHGDGVNTFGGIWHVVKTSATKPASTNTGTTSPPSTPYSY
jgi:predicted lipoprotein with Yx(FWY)xxD motif